MFRTPLTPKLAILAVLCAPLLSGCMQDATDEGGPDPSRVPPAPMGEGNQTWASFMGCHLRFPDGSPIPCDGGIDQSFSDDPAPDGGRCEWRVERTNGEIEFLSDGNGLYWAEFEFEPSVPDPIVAGWASVSTEQGTVSRLFTANQSKGSVLLGPLDGKHREFHFNSSQISYALKWNESEQSAKDMRHEIERYRFQEWDWIVWAIEGPGGSARFAQTRATMAFGRTYYEPVSFFVAGDGFTIEFNGRSMFTGTGGYSEEEPILPPTSEPASPLCR